MNGTLKFTSYGNMKVPKPLRVIVQLDYIGNYAVVYSYSSRVV